MRSRTESGRVDRSLRPALLFLLLVALAGCTTERPEEPVDRPESVRVVTVEPGRFVASLTCLGRVRSAAEADVVALEAGRIAYVDRFASGLRNGLAVRAGERLATLTNPEVAHALAEARLRERAAAAELDRRQRAFAAGIESEAQLAPYQAEAAVARERLAAAEERARRLEIRSPLDGVLSGVDAVPSGVEIDGGTVLARVLAGDELEVVGWAPAADRELLAEGLPVRFATPGGGEEPVGAGTVRDVAPEIGPGGTVEVVVEVTDPEGLPAPGEGVELSVELAARERAITVPEEALVANEGGSAVFVVERRQGLRATRRPVRLGLRGDGRVEVLDGLDPGERVVVNGVAFLTGDTLVTVLDDGDGG